MSTALRRAAVGLAAADLGDGFTFAQADSAIDRAIGQLYADGDAFGIDEAEAIRRSDAWPAARLISDIGTVQRVLALSPPISTRKGWAVTVKER